MRINKSGAQKQRRHRAAGAAKQGGIIGVTAEICIDRLAHDGRGIGRLDGKIAFVENALPGETHKIKFINAKSKFVEAKSELLIGEPNHHRVAPLCTYYESCGGCQIQHLNAELQLDFKSRLILDQLKRVGIEVPQDCLEPIVSENNFGYRSRARLSLNHKGVPFAGFRTKGNNQIIKIETCPVLVSSLSDLLSPLQKVLAKFRSEVLGHIELMVGDKRPILILRNLLPLNEEEIGLLSSLGDGDKLNVYLQHDNSPVYMDLHANAVDIGFGLDSPQLKTPIRYGASNFCQVNTPVNQRMVTQALTWISPAKDEVWVDLFCGVGNFSLPLSVLVKQVVGVEAMEDMVLQAKLNSTNMNLENCDFIAADLESSVGIRKLPKFIDGIILDPPRAGAKYLMENIAKLNPKKILYVSCDPATFSRDAKTLVLSGYQLKKVGALDMFPQTMHVETMALFTR